MYPDFFEHTLVQAGFQKRKPDRWLRPKYTYESRHADRAFYVGLTDLNPDTDLPAIEVLINVPNYGNFLIHTLDLQRTARSLLHDTSWSEQELDVLRPFGLTVICDSRHSDELQRRLQQPEVQQTVGELAQAGESFYLFSNSSSFITFCVAMRQALPERLRVWLGAAYQFADVLITSDRLSDLVNKEQFDEEIEKKIRVIILAFIFMLLLVCIVLNSSNIIVLLLR